MVALPLVMVLSYPLNIKMIYFACCLLVALFGIRRRMGFWGYLFFSMIFSPILGLIVLLVSGRKRLSKKERKKMKRLSVEK